MKKFLVLLKKELRELITLQLIVPILVTVAIFFGLGQVISQQQEAATTQPQHITVLHQDTGYRSKELLNYLELNNMKLTVLTDGTVQSARETASTNNSALTLVIPSDYTVKLEGKEPTTLDMYTTLRSFSPFSAVSYQIAASVINAASTQVSRDWLAEAGLEAESALQPIRIQEHVQIGAYTADAKVQEVMAVVSQQGVFIPIILFFVIVFASQLIATSVASEKENKTLETLLTLPVKRHYIVISKMLAAALIAAIMSGFYMYGMKNYMGSLMATGNNPVVSEITQSLHLTLDTGQYVILGLSLFFAILTALAMAMILGAFAEDIKSVQGLLTPLMVLTLIPYVLSFVVDFTTLPTSIKWAVYAIPFTHTFQAMPNLIMQNTTAVWYGILYLAVFFVVFAWIATKLFTSDRIVTLKINLGKKKQPTA